MPSETTTYVNYANVQMAAEALFVPRGEPSGTTFSGSITPGILTGGNERSSRFPVALAEQFSRDWVVVEHKSDTATGFSGTLFRCVTNDPTRGLRAGELVMSFRSTEFIDDAVRDNQATNKMEISQFGWSFGQIADMEDWYAQLQADGRIPSGSTLTVTGYSLGGHLATAFNLLHPEAVDATYTFNGAGVGTVNAGSTLAQVITQFDRQRTNLSGNEIVFTDPQVQALYEQLRARFAGGVAPTQSDIQSAGWTASGGRVRVIGHSLGGGHDWVQAGAGVDFLEAFLPGNHYVEAGDRRDTVWTPGGDDDVIWGGTATSFDEVNIQTVAVGDEQADQLSCAAGDDLLFGGTNHALPEDTHRARRSAA